MTLALLPSNAIEEEAEVEEPEVGLAESFLQRFKMRDISQTFLCFFTHPYMHETSTTTSIMSQHSS